MPNCEMGELESAGNRRGPAARRMAAAVPVVVRPAGVVALAALAVAAVLALYGQPAAAQAVDAPSTPVNRDAPVDELNRNLDPNLDPSLDAAPEVTPEAPGGGDVLGRRYIGAEEFRRAFEDRTVHLSSGAQHYGSEFYLPGDRSLWIGGDGPCRLGEWTYNAPLFCFTYGSDGPYCWRVFQQDNEFFAESIDGLVLRIYAVEERPLQCDQDLFS